MFDVFCPGHGCRVLLTTRQIEEIVPVADGMVVLWRCWCGTAGRLVTGRSR